MNDNAIRFEVWISQDALFRGIYKVQAERPDAYENSIRFINPFHPGKQFWRLNIGKAHWHRTKEEAIAVAEEMRARKIGQLERQIEKLKALDFASATGEPPEEYRNADFVNQNGEPCHIVESGAVLANG